MVWTEGEEIIFGKEGGRHLSGIPRETVLNQSQQEAHPGNQAGGSSEQKAVAPQEVKQEGPAGGSSGQGPMETSGAIQAGGRL